MAFRNWFRGTGNSRPASTRRARRAVPPDGSARGACQVPRVHVESRRHRVRGDPRHGLATGRARRGEPGCCAGQRLARQPPCDGASGAAPQRSVDPARGRVASARGARQLQLQGIPDGAGPPRSPRFVHAGMSPAAAATPAGTTGSGFLGVHERRGDQPGQRDRRERQKDGPTSAAASSRLPSRRAAQLCRGNGTARPGRTRPVGVSGAPSGESPGGGRARAERDHPVRRRNLHHRAQRLGRRDSPRRGRLEHPDRQLERTGSFKIAAGSTCSFCVVRVDAFWVVSGTSVFAAGEFGKRFYTVAANSVALWNGSAWSALGKGLYSCTACSPVQAERT